MFSKARAWLSPIVKVVVCRKFKPHHENSLLFKQGYTAMVQLRQHAARQRGFISSEVLVNFDDKNDHMLITQWEDLATWVNFRSSPERKRLYNLIAPHLAESDKINVYLVTSRTTKQVKVRLSEDTDAGLEALSSPKTVLAFQAAPKCVEAVAN